MAFVRLAGCSVGCPQCDTDYTVDSRATEGEIVDRVVEVMPLTRDRDSWVWITGGEPTDHELRPLLGELKARGFATALATSGVRRMIPPVDWLSVSPHSLEPGKFHQRYGSEIKLVDGLHGLSIDEWARTWPDDTTDFMYRYVQPMSYRHEHDDRSKLLREMRGMPATEMREDPASLARCMAFLKEHPRWALSRQDHHAWQVP